MEIKSTNLVETLRWRAQNQAQKLAYRFLADGEFEEIEWTYEQVDRRARAIGALLQSCTRAGDRALMLFPPGPDFITAYMGCLYAKVLAIPAYPPHPVRFERSLPIIERIVADAAPAAVLLPTAVLATVNTQHKLRAAFGKARLLATDSNDTDAWTDQWQQPDIKGEDIAFLQYTSGSTTSPKGVILSHDNLLHNMTLIGKCYGVSAESHGVIWLPPYHDMGLIGGVTQPIFSGTSVTLMPHMMFLQRPLRWLQAISRFRATISGGPNFAYDLCVRKIQPQDRDSLDLSSWELAFNGAEPVYYKTLEQFADYFAPCGFRREAFLPCYGLAEATLMVAGGPRGRSPVMLHLKSEGLEQDLVVVVPEKGEDTRTLVSCGQNISDQIIKIVHPATLTAMGEDEIGEIWVRGGSVSGGYWNQHAETEKTFGAYTSDGEGPFLRSGDLGFFHHQELFVTGRIKNLIISEGKNHYPQDIERTVEAAHPAIRPAGCAVFSIRHADEEREQIIVVAEIERRLTVPAEEITKSVHKAIVENHGLHAHDIRLLIPGSIPRTTSGKIRHFLCKTTYLAGALKEISSI